MCAYRGHFSASDALFLDESLWRIFKPNFADVTLDERADGNFLATLYTITGD